MDKEKEKEVREVNTSRDYYKDSKEFKGIPLDVNALKRDYYIPIKEKKEKEKKPLASSNRKVAKDYEYMAKMHKEKFYIEYQAYPLFKRRAIILTVSDKEILKQLEIYEKNDKMRALIIDKLKRL